MYPLDRELSGNHQKRERLAYKFVDLRALLKIINQSMKLLLLVHRPRVASKYVIFTIEDCWRGESLENLRNWRVST